MSLLLLLNYQFFFCKKLIYRLLCCSKKSTFDAAKLFKYHDICKCLFD
jgi:hypothetical protein